MGVRVGFVQREEFRETGSGDRVAAHADQGRNAEPALDDFGGDFVGQGAAAGHDPDVALLVYAVNPVGDGAEHGFAHGDDARGVAAHDHRAAGKRGPADLDGFVQRDAVGDGADLFDARVEGLKHGVLGELGRHEQHGDVGGVVLYAPADGMVHRDAVHVLPFLAGGDAEDDLRAHVFHVLRPGRRSQVHHAPDYGHPSP